ncbi:hypothetical protein [Thiomicrorhabdus xiamenensis]|uniref:Transmembrane transcriptional regulator (Anti-sigma factor RsiW) n=1 Tax=Thiomicrorhabdus xiamenensis TaxID=2739063 RepID=A0A7D4NPS1_9GAMM|nr:hypothetical protein [Thiomicrorhabdus xiamenensis]QKI88110.1 hypothetical protein HQN79_00265 [Thiomicrorhabdus xiamenensis]
MHNKIEDYQLQAYVDDQLSTEERLEVERCIEADAQLIERVAELRALKSSIRQAYGDISVPEPVFSLPAAKKPFWNVPKAAAAALVMGVLLGGNVGFLQHSTDLQTMQASALNENVVTDKFIIHIDSDDLSKQVAALHKIKSLYAEKGPSLKVDVITNSDGVRLFDINSPNNAELSALLEQYSGIALYACQRALQRASLKGEPIHLIDKVKHNKPAVDEMAERLNSGWSYIKI